MLYLIEMTQEDVSGKKTSSMNCIWPWLWEWLHWKEMTRGLYFPWTVRSTVIFGFIQELALQKIDSTMNENSAGSWVISRRWVSPENLPVEKLPELAFLNLKESQLGIGHLRECSDTAQAKSFLFLETFEIILLEELSLSSNNAWRNRSMYNNIGDIYKYT